MSTRVRLPKRVLERSTVRVVNAGESWLQGRFDDRLRRRGWRPTVVPFTGHGNPTRVHVAARVLLMPAQVRQDSSSLRSSLLRFVTAELACVPVTVRVGQQTFEVEADREGYVFAALDVEPLAPGWHDVGYQVEGEDERLGRVRVFDPAAPLAIVSDIDDTVIETELTRAIRAVRNTIFVPVEKRLAVPGVALLYRALTRSGAPIVYLSTGAWNFHRTLMQFLDLHGFPLGPLLLTDWGPTPERLFRSGKAHKLAQLRLLLADHPGTHWVLVGDTSQHDPDVYAEVAHEAPDRIRAIYIRDLGWQRPADEIRARAVADELAQIGVPMILAKDALEMARHAQSIGLVRTSDVDLIESVLED